MKIINGWQSLRIALSIIWFTLASFLYFDNLVHYPKSYIEHFQISSLYDCFNLEEDYERKQEAMDYAKAHGKEAEANFLIATGFRFVKPTFSLFGFLSFILVPIFFIWLILYFLFGTHPIDNASNQMNPGAKRRGRKKTTSIDATSYNNNKIIADTKFENLESNKLKSLHPKDIWDWLNTDNDQT